MIVIVTVKETDEHTGRTDVLVSHGIDENDNVIPMSNEKLSYMIARKEAVWCEELNEWIIEE